MNLDKLIDVLGTEYTILAAAGVGVLVGFVITLILTRLFRRSQDNYLLDEIEEMIGEHTKKLQDASELKQNGSEFTLKNIEKQIGADPVKGSISKQLTDQNEEILEALRGIGAQPEKKTDEKPEEKTGGRIAAAGLTEKEKEILKKLDERSRNLEEKLNRERKIEKALSDEEISVTKLLQYFDKDYMKKTKEIEEARLTIDILKNKIRKMTAAEKAAGTDAKAEEEAPAVPEEIKVPEEPKAEEAPAMEPEIPAAEDDGKQMTLNDIVDEPDDGIIMPDRMKEEA